MRKPITILLIVVLVLTLLVLGFSYFIQPRLTPEINSFLSILFVALVGVVGVVAGILQFIEYRKGERGQPIFNPDQNQKLRNRRNMLQLVWNTWIEGVLKKSLYNEMLIELGMETQPNAVDHPWDMVIQMPDQQPRKVTPGTTMLELFNLTSEALLILGEPGSGKTTMLLELTRQAILRAQEDPVQLIPIVFNLSSWTPKQSIIDWLVNELNAKYYISPKIGRPWVENDELLLLLDGLDEVEAEFRDACTIAINSFRIDHSMPMVVCCRRQEYEDLRQHLSLHGAVVIQPLTSQQVGEYLQNVAPGLERVSLVIQQDPDLLEFTKTPLILNIIVFAFREASRQDIEAFIGVTNHRKVLFDTYILQMYKRKGLQKSYTFDKTTNWLEWLAGQMLRHAQSLFNIEDIHIDWLPKTEQKRAIINIWLVIGLLGGLIGGLIIAMIGGGAFGLLFGLSIGIIGSRLIALGEVGLKSQENTSNIASKSEGSIINPKVSLISGIVVGAISLLIGWHSIDFRAGLVFGVIFGSIFGLLFGMLAGLGTGLNERGFSRPTDRLSWSWSTSQQGLILNLRIALLLGLLGALLFSIRLGIIGGLIIGIICSLSIGLLGGFLGGLQGSEVENRSTPMQGIQTSLRNTVFGGLIGSFLFCLLGFLIMWLLLVLLFGSRPEQDRVLYFSLQFGVRIGLLGFLVGGLRYGGGFVLSNAIMLRSLFRSGSIPKDYINFLDYCTDRIFLRRVGGGYIFIHRMLMEHFAAMDDEISEGLIPGLG